MKSLLGKSLVAGAANLVGVNAVADGLIALAYAAIAACFLLVGRKLLRYPQIRNYGWLVLASAVFVISCGITHAMAVITVWQPLAPFSAAIKALCVAVSVPTALYLGARTPVVLANLARMINTLANSALYRAQAEAIDRSQMVIELALDETVLKVNQNYTRCFGYAPEEIQGKRFSLVVTSEDLQNGAYQAFWAALRSGQFQTGQYERVTKSGQPIWIEASYNPILDAQGVPLKVIGLLTDVSSRVRMERERERQEEALRKSEEFLEETGNLAGVGGWEVDLITGAVTWMPETYRLLGANPSYQPTLASSLDLYTETSKPVITVAIEQAKARGTSFDLELSLLSLDQRVIWARVVGKARFADGKPVRLFGAFQDITRRIDERTALQWANQRAELATTSGGIGIWDWDLTKNTLVCDAQMYLMVHQAPQRNKEIELAAWMRFVHPEDVARVEQELQEAISGVKAFSSEYRILLEDGVHFVRATGQVSRDGNDRPIRMVGTNIDITARVTEQKALEHANLRAKLATDSGGIGIWEWEVDTGILLCDAWMFRLYGYLPDPSEPHAYEFWARRLHPDDRDPMERALNDALNDVRPYDIEFRVVWDDGSVHWLKANATVDRDPSGKPFRMVGTNFDITSRVLEKTALEKANTLAKLATVSTGIGIWEWDVPNGVFLCDERSYVVWGAKPEPGVTHELAFWVGRIHPEDQAAVHQALQDSLDDIRAYDIEFRILWDDGSLHWIKATGVVERDAAGRPMRMVGTCVDITARIAEQMALREANERIELATESGGIGIWEWDLVSGRVILDSRTLRLFDLEAHAGAPITHQTWVSRLHPEDRPLAEMAVRQSLEGRRPLDLDFRVVWNDGSIHHLRGTAKVVWDEAGRPRRMIGTNVEITQRTMAEESLRQSDEDQSGRYENRATLSG